MRYITQNSLDRPLISLRDIKHEITIALFLRVFWLKSQDEIYTLITKPGI